MELGLLYYGARFYVPGLGRFASADSIIPNPANPQSYNRYSYVLNRALNFTDPTGHRECAHKDLDCSNPVPRQARGGLLSFSKGNTFSDAEKATFREGAEQVAQALFEIAGEEFNSPREVFRAVYGGTVEIRQKSVSCAKAFGNSDYTCYASAAAHHINIYTNAAGDIEGNVMWVMHELFHSFNANAIPAGAKAGQPYLDLQANLPW
ncbi:MAG: RHS repeat-associated core domain-containing protein [Chloroflexi bacterium]|nr:RHS repeat-associated core domain-containing protein [Ardenticatenaceae bacterium]MBL1131631.1 RHS repeat-associated core domain-containing protein [Chloroflexota bacterium]NOG37748.1 RHS repeat-associated core domain-containing protein [Chloroflexota bacterium]